MGAAKPTEPSLDRPVELLKDVYAEMRAEDVPFMAGALAYQAFVSLLPLLVLLVVVLATVGGEALVERLLSLTGEQIPASTQDLIVGSVRSAAGNANASIIGVATLAFGAFKIFRGLDKAFAILFDTEKRQSLVGSVEDGAIVFGAVIVAVVALLVAGSAFALVPNLPLGGLLPPLVLVAGLAVAFLPMYYVFPNLDLDLKTEVLPGVAVAAVGWALLEAVFQIYVSVTSGTDTYGVLGAVLVLVTWLYFGSLVLLAAGTLNAVLAGRAGRDHPKRQSADRREPVTSFVGFERRLDELLDEARRNGVSEDAVLADFRRRAQTPADVWHGGGNDLESDAHPTDD